MKQIGAEIGVNESRVSQLHARAIRRLREALGDMGPQQVAEMRKAFATFAARRPMLKAQLPAAREEQVAATPAVVLPYKAPRRPVPVRAAAKPIRAPRVAAAR
jgi:hypothetical protein